MTEEIITLPSSDGIHTLKGVLYRPEGEPIGIFHVIHGMTDYTRRYGHLLSEMAKAGFVSFGIDLLGHGETAEEGELGFIAEKRGDRLLAKDTVLAARAVRERFGAELLYCMAGHSMGSFVARCAVAEGFLPDRLILLGTAGSNAAAPIGSFLARMLGVLRGKKHISHVLEGLVFRDYDKGFPGDWNKRWITVDTENLVRYQDDPFCTFHFTVSAMGNLIDLNRRANSSAFYRKSKGCRVLLLSGSEDPVGHYGKGVKQVYRRLLRYGADARIQLFSGFRHEILQDFCKEDVILAIREFCSDSVVSALKK